MLAAVLNAHDAGEDVGTWRLVDELLLDSARREWAVLALIGAALGADAGTPC
jgi:hypothetical protein